MNHTVVLYHANCADGFGAAWAAWRKLGTEGVIYQAVQYGQPYPPELDSGGVSTLYLLDFSYPLDTMKRLTASVPKIVVIDHHKTAEEPLRRWEAWFPHNAETHYHVVFDQSKSGAVLTWEYFHGEPPFGLPALLKYVQDRDLWRWELPSSREMSAAIASYPWDFDTWEAMGANSNKLPEQGEAILRYQQQQVERHVANATVGEVGGWQVPVVNATCLQSEIGHALCEKFKEAPFSATFFVRYDGKRIWSLRSRGDFDVSEVAKAKGGGGHKSAAGFEEAPPPARAGSEEPPPL